MENKILLEGYLFSDMTEFAYKSGKRGYQGTIVSYKDSESKFYNAIPFSCNEFLYKQIIEQRMKGLRLFLIGQIHSSKSGVYVYAEYIAICPVQKDTKYSVPREKKGEAEVVKDAGTAADNGVETNTNGEEEVGELTDDDLPF